MERIAIASHRTKWPSTVLRWPSHCVSTNIRSRFGSFISMANIVNATEADGGFGRPGSGCSAMRCVFASTVNRTSTEPVSTEPSVECCWSTVCRAQTPLMHAHCVYAHCSACKIAHFASAKRRVACLLFGRNNIDSPRVTLPVDDFVYYCNCQTDDNRSIRRKNTKHKFQPKPADAIYLLNSESDSV